MKDIIYLIDVIQGVPSHLNKFSELDRSRGHKSINSTACGTRKVSGRSSHTRGSANDTFDRVIEDASTSRTIRNEIAILGWHIFTKSTAVRAGTLLGTGLTFDNRMIIFVIRNELIRSPNARCTKRQRTNHVRDRRPSNSVTISNLRKRSNIAKMLAEVRYGQTRPETGAKAAGGIPAKGRTVENAVGPCAQISRTCARRDETYTRT
ncbi:hypothetical protein PUN28_018940 [Cardiocondyla obscurior]|uniref:Uncharacterized protein n=1 Tax=Cardiocondyla obscurior TaxID=286306 RepID=A0AAW2EGZ3_9HYME